tara:strand:- start:599 stop:802 length:204 start_codon:yes stop_codon:yes gene_type:complete
MAFDKMKSSIPMILVFVVILIHLALSGYFLFGGTVNLDFLSFLGNFNRVWFISIMLCIAAAVLLAYS